MDTPKNDGHLEKCIYVLCFKYGVILAYLCYIFRWGEVYQAKFLGTHFTIGKIQKWNPPESRFQGHPLIGEITSTGAPFFILDGEAG